MKRNLSLQAARKLYNCCCSLIKFLFQINSIVAAESVGDCERRRLANLEDPRSAV